jgi:hypothetical protein
MPEPTVEWFNLGCECVSLEVQRCRNQVLIGFQIIYATDTTKGFAKSRIHRYPDPAFGFILAKKLQSSLISMNQQASVWGEITGNCSAG